MKNQTPHVFRNSCGGQNGNLKMTYVVMYIVNSLENINGFSGHTLVTDHTYLPSDGDYSLEFLDTNKDNYLSQQVAGIGENMDDVTFYSWQ